MNHKVIPNTKFSNVFSVSNNLKQYLDFENNDHRRFYAKFINESIDNSFTIWIDDPKDFELLASYFTVPITIDLITNTIYETLNC